MSRKANRTRDGWKRFLMGGKSNGGFRGRKSGGRRGSGGFTVEALEPRLLLNAALYDGAVTEADSANGVAGATDAQDAIKTQFIATLTNLGQLGEGLNADGSLNDTLDGTGVPMLDQTLRDVLGDDVGKYFTWADEVGEQAGIEAYLSNYGDTDAGNGDQRPDSAGLALELQTAMSNAGLTGSVTDSSTNYGLQFDFSFSLSSTLATDLKLGEAAEEFNLRLEDGTSINVSNDRIISFSIGADLSILDPATTVGGPPPAPPTAAEKLVALQDDTNFWVDFGQYQATSLAQQTTTTYGGLDDFGIQIGILGGQQGGTGAGAWVDADSGVGIAGPSAQFLLDVTSYLDFSKGEDLITVDGRMDLAEFRSISTAATPDWSAAYDLELPTGQASAIGGGFQTNTVDAIFQVEVANPAGNTFIGGLDGVTGQLSFSDDNLFDDRAPLVTADETMSAFSRITPRDLLNMVDSTTAWAEALDNSELFRDQLPFLNLDEGDAFAFGEAFRKVFLNQMQNAEQVLTAVNAPFTWYDDGSGALVRNPLGFTGGGSFLVSYNGGAFGFVTVFPDAARNSLQAVVSDLNAALVGAGVGGASGMQARLTDTESPRIEIFAPDPDQFVMTGFKAAGIGVLDFGFNAYSEVVLANNSANFGNGVAAGEEYQLGGIAFESGAAIDVTDFSSVRTFTIEVNGGAAVNVIIPIQSYSGVGALVARLRDVLAAEGLFDAAAGTGVVVDVLDLGNGDEGIRIYGTGEIYGLTISGTGLAELNLAAAAQTSEYIDFTITRDGTASSYRTYFSGNRTNGLAGSNNIAMSDLADDLRYGLENTTFVAGVLTPLLDQAAGTGIDIRGDNSGSLQFFARNSGDATGKISQIEIAAISGGLSQLAFGTTPANNGQSAPFALSKRFISANFTSLQDFAAVVAGGSLAAAAQPVFDTSRMSITFPIEFDYTPASLTGTQAVDVLLDSEYGEISQLQTDSSVTVDRTTNSSFGFEVGLVPDTAVAEVLEVEVSVGVANWDGQMQGDGILQVILDDGVVHDLRIDAVDTADNTDPSDFAADVQAKIDANAALVGKLTVTTRVGADTRYERLVFTTDPANTNTRMLQVLAPDRIASSVVTANGSVTNLGFAVGQTNLIAVTDTVTAAGLASFNLTPDTRALFRFDLLDGNSGDVVLNASETADNSSLQDLIDDLNFAIEQSLELSTEFEGKVEAFDDGGKIGFRLNANVFPNDGSYAAENWSLEVVATYFEPQPNAVSGELYVKERTAAGALTDVRLTVVSKALQGSNPFLLSDPAVFQISINGSDYVTVTVPAGSGTPTMGDLISDINVALAATPVTIGGVYDLSDFLRAGTYGDGSRVAIFSLDNSAAANPIVRTFRFVPDDGVVNNSATTALGFLVEEQRIGARGGEVFLNNIALTGEAAVTNQTVTAEGYFGFVAFEAGDGQLDLRAKETTNFGGRLTLQDLNRATSTDNLTSISTQVVNPSTFASLQLRNLSFPVDANTGEAFAGLAFGPGASITLKHDPTGMAGPSASKISDFANLPAPDLVYNNTRGMEMLYTVGFEDIIEGLLRTAEYISDQMRIDPDGAAAGVNAFESKLLFVKSGLVDVFDLGYELEQYILRLESAKPASLQELKNTMAGIFQLDLADIGLSLATTYSGGLLQEASIDLSLPFVKAFATSLPLFVDLSQLRNRSSDPAIVDDYLAGLSALASTGSNPMEVELSILADLDLDLGIQVVRGGISRQPRAVIYQSSQINTLVNLAGENFNGDLPVGNARFRLSNGMVAVNKFGEVANDDANGTPGIYNQAMMQPGYVQPAGLTVDVATTADLGGTYTNPAFGNDRLDAGASGQLVIDGVSVSIGDLVLVNHQSNVAYNGVYSVIRDGSGAGANANWRLSRVNAANTAAELNDLFVSVTGGNTYAGRDFIQVQDPVNVGADAVRFARLIDPATFEINLQGDQVLPYLVRVATTGELSADFVTIDGKDGLRATSTGSLNAVVSTLADGRQVVGIDGVPDLKVNDLILVKDQVNGGGGNNSFQNGVYRVKVVGNGTTAWELVRVSFADEAGEFAELRIAVAEGNDNGGVRLVQDNNVPGLAAGVTINFNNSLERVYSNADGSGGFDKWAIVNPNGQGRAILPMVIVVTDENGNEIIITKDTSELTDEQKNDPAVVAALPDFDPVDIRVLNYDDGTGLRTGLDRFFDVTVPANTPGVPAPAVFFSDPSMPWLELPRLGRNIPPTDVLNILRDPFIMGEALDLALFNLQFAIDQALGNYIPLLGTDLPSSTIFIETWRSDFTNRVRDELRNNKLKPINTIIDSLFAILGPGGEGFLTTKAEIVVETLDAAEVATIWDPNAASNYDLTPANEEFEVVPGSAVSLQFSLDLVKLMDDNLSEININRIDLSQTGTGLIIDTETVSQTIVGDTVTNTVTTGGINLRRSFVLHLGFGVDLQEGFYLYNPADDPTDGVDTPVMSVGIEAVLDGDINTAGVQIFEQNKRTSTLNELLVQVADAADTPGPNSLGVDFLSASGFYGTFDFYLNQASGGSNLNRMTIQDMQTRNTLGIDPALPVTGQNQVGSFEFGILSFQTDGDLDLHLLIEGGKPGSSFGGGQGIPDIQTEFTLQIRYGIGASQLNYLGVLAPDGVTSMQAASLAAYNVVLDDQANGTSNATDEQLALSAQVFRYNRNLIDGSAFDYFNIQVDVEGFLQGTIFESLQKFSQGIQPIRPLIDFLLKPLPGTEWMSSPFVLADFLGAAFVDFAAGVVRLDDMVRGMGVGAGADPKPLWARPRVKLSVGGSVWNKIKTTVGKDSRLTKARNNVEKYKTERDAAREKARQNREDDDVGRGIRFVLDGETDDRTALKRMKDSFEEKATTPNKFSKRFEKFRNDGFAKNENDGKLKSYVKKKANEALTLNNDSAKASKTPIAGISGGGFRLDFAKQENVIKILLGQEANLTFLELPRVELGVAVSQSFPLPAFPPLIATVGFSISANINLKFGWDTEGFYWSTLNLEGQATPAFGILARFNVGVALSAGLIEAGIEAFFELQVDFNWNDVTVDTNKATAVSAGTAVDTDAYPFPPSFGDPGTPGYGKLRNSQMDYLKSLPGADAKMGNLFDVTLTGRIGLTFYVDLTIPIPFVGPITKRILEKTFAMNLFQVTFFADKPGIQLATQNGSTLDLNIGARASLRLFNDTRGVNEVYTLTTTGASGSGEDITITAILNGVTYTQTFNGIRLVKGSLGAGEGIVDASALGLALVDLTGGSGNSTLYSGNGYLGGGKNKLTGGEGTATLFGSTSRSSVLRAGLANTTIIGGTAADDIYSGQRSDILDGGGGGDTYFFSDGFGRDRLVVTGLGNIADFSGVTTDLTFDLGRLVQSAKTGLNTVFFAPDAAGSNSIDTWIAGSGDDRFNTFFFAPDRTTRLEGGAGADFYAVTLGNPTKRYFADTNPGGTTLLDQMDPRNIGYINITDSSDDGWVLIKQTFPERISYAKDFINNGREQATMTGISRVDLDAGNATVVWGDPSREWVDLGVGSTVTAGTIEMRSSVEAEGLTLNLKRSFSITERLVMRNNSDLQINIQNIDPLGDSSLFIGPGPTSQSPIGTVGIYSSDAAVFGAAGAYAANAWNGNGSGYIDINLPTGSLFNVSSTATGVIEALGVNGEVAIDVRDTIGFDSDPVKINATWLAAKTTTTLATLAQGINIISDRDIQISKIRDIDGLSTVSGSIRLEVNSGQKIVLGRIVAGDGRDIILEADEVTLDTAGRTEYRTEVESYLKPVTVNYSYEVQVLRSTQVLWWTYYYWETVTYQSSYTYYVTAYRDVQVAYTIPPIAGGGVIDTSGNVYIRNVTDDYNIRIADVLPQAGLLNVTRGVLDTITNQANGIIIGRNQAESVQSGVLSLLNYDFATAVTFKGSQIDILGQDPAGASTALTSTNFFEFDAYEGTGNGAIQFSNGNGSSSVVAPSIFATAFRDITVNTALSSTDDNGLIQLTAGLRASTTGGADDTGSLTIGGSGSVLATGLDSRVVMKSGAVSGAMNISGSVAADDRITLEAKGGGITVNTPARLTSAKLNFDAALASTLRTAVDDIISGRVINGTLGGSADLTIDELDGLTLTLLETDAGTIDVTAGGGIVVDQVIGGTLPSVFDVTLDAQGGAVTRVVPNPGEVNVVADDLVVTALGGVTLDTAVNSLDIRALNAGDVIINNINGQASPLLINRIMTSNGAIQVDTEGSMNARLVSSVTDDSANTIVLRTRGLFGGSILLDVIDAGNLGDVTIDAGGFTPGSLPFGGTVLSDSSTAGRITANNLIVNARGYPVFVDTFDLGIDLRTTVNNIIAKTFSSGDPSEATSAVGIRINETDAIGLVELETFLGDIQVVAGGDITHDSVRAANRDITLTSTGGSILSSDINGDTFQKIFGRELTALATGAIVMDTTVGGITADSTGSGDLTITESDGVKLRRITTNAGDINITAGEFAGGVVTKGGNVEADLVRAGAAGGDDVTLTAYGTLRTAGQGGAGLSVLWGGKVEAGLFTATSYGTMNLLTNVAVLNAENFTIGNMVIVEDSAVEVQRLVSASGSIDLRAGGGIIARYVESKADISQANTFDINLQALTGDILVDRVDAGGVYNDITITADMGSINEVDPQDAPDGFISPDSSGIDLVADNAVLSAFGSIGGLRAIETRFNTLTAQANAAGAIDLNEFDAINIQLMETADGSITVDAGGTITIGQMRSLTDSDANDVTVSNTVGDILIDEIIAGVDFGDLTLTAAAGSINEVNPQDTPDGFISPDFSGIDLTADAAVINASGSIGGLRPLETRFNTLDANSTVAGDIDLNEFDAIELLSVGAANGSIILDAGGEIIARQVETFTDLEGIRIDLRNTAGDILVDWVSAGINAADLFITSDAGSIEEVDPQDSPDGFAFPDTSGIDLVADRGVLTAFDDIGGLRPIETRFNYTSAVSQNDGDINLNEYDGTILENVVSVAGSINIAAEGDVVILHAEILGDRDDWDINISSLTGDVYFGFVDAGSNFGDVTITAMQGAIFEYRSDSGVDLRGDVVTLNALNGIGTEADPIESDINTLFAEVHSDGGFYLDDIGDITLERVVTFNGAIEVKALGSMDAVEVLSRTDSSAASILLDARGRLSVDEVIAGSDSFGRGNPARSGNVTLKGGSIQELGNDPTVDVRGANLDFQAGSGIGAVANPLEVVGTNINSVTRKGDNALNSLFAGPVVVSQLNTGSGTAFFSQTGGTVTFGEVVVGSGAARLNLFGGGNMNVTNVNVGKGNIALTVGQGGRLVLNRLSVGGDARLTADEMDFIGGPGSISGSGTLSISAYSPDVLLLVHPFGVLPDLPGVLEIDILDFLAFNFGRIEFLGLVEIILPVYQSKEAFPFSPYIFPIGVEGSGGEQGSEPLLAGVSSIDDLLGGFRSEEFLEKEQLRAYIENTFGFSPWAMSGLDESILDLLASGLFNQVEWMDIFEAYFGFSPQGMVGLDGSFFDRLIESLESEQQVENLPDVPKENAPPSQSIPFKKPNTSIDPLGESQGVTVTRVELSEILNAEDLEITESNSSLRAADLLHSGLHAAIWAPMALAEAMRGIRRRFFDRAA